MYSNYMKARRRRACRKDASKVQPNFFVAIQVPSPEIHKAVLDVHDALCDANFKNEPELVKVAKLHITLLVMHIENDEQLLDASTALDHCGVILSEKFAGTPILLSFQGLSHFSNKVIFAKPVEDDHYRTLKDIGNIVKAEFSKINVTLTNQRELNPHLTIARLLERPNFKDKTALSEINNKFRNVKFGSQYLSGLQLLRMSDDSEEKDDNGYYIMARQVNFDASKEKNGDQVGCSSLKVSPF